MAFHKHLNPIYLARKKQKKYDHLAYIIIGVTFFITLPQVIQLFQTQSAGDISLISWVGFIFISVFWLIYGFERKMFPIIVSSLVHLAVNFVMVYGILEYGNYNVL